MVPLCNSGSGALHHHRWPTEPDVCGLVSAGRAEGQHHVPPSLKLRGRLCTVNTEQGGQGSLVLEIGTGKGGGIRGNVRARAS